MGTLAGQRYASVARMKSTGILLVTCVDRRGVVASIADFIYAHNGDILRADEHKDAELNLFLMRVEFDASAFDIALDDFAEHFSPVASQFAMTWRLARAEQRPRMAIFVSKYDHCLVDLLYRWKNGELKCDIAFILSNHSDNRRHADFYGVPYHVVPVTKDNKREAEARQIALIEEHRVDFVALARYMQVLSNEFVKRYPQRIINIHHSFLPAFIGAKPYHQAYERGVKLIGATGHYVTEVLDDGPIIEQDVVRVTHRDTQEDLIEKGRDIESAVLSRAVRWHIESRVLLYGNKTVVFI
jgi:formyltetrahydrofolate deformylase